MTPTSSAFVSGWKRTMRTGYAFAQGSAPARGVRPSATGCASRAAPGPGAWCCRSSSCVARCCLGRARCWRCRSIRCKMLRLGIVLPGPPARALDQSPALHRRALCRGGRPVDVPARSMVTAPGATDRVQVEPRLKRRAQSTPSARSSRRMFGALALPGTTGGCRCQPSSNSNVPASALPIDVTPAKSICALRPERNSCDKSCRRVSSPHRPSGPEDGTPSRMGLVQGSTTVPGQARPGAARGAAAAPTAAGRARHAPRMQPHRAHSGAIARAPG